MSSDWVKHQEERFAKDSVIEEALKNPIQRERVDVAVKFIGGPGLKVLDVGCGDGAISELIHNNGNECWGMDLPAVQDTVPEERKKWLNVRPGDASRKPWAAAEVPIASTTSGTLGMTKWSSTFDDEFFDAIFAGEIIEHMMDLEPFLTEAWRVLKPDGRLILTTPNAVRALNRVAMLLGAVHTWHEWDKGVPHHIRYFTPQTLQMAVAKYGFRPERIGYGRSQAEGSELGFSNDWLEEFSPEERGVLLKILDRACPGPEWRHSFVILEARKMEVKS